MRNPDLMTVQDYKNCGFEIVEVNSAIQKYKVKIPSDLADELPKKMHEIGTGNGILWLKEELKKRCNNNPGFRFQHFIA